MWINLIISSGKMGRVFSNMFNVFGTLKILLQQELKYIEMILSYASFTWTHFNLYFNRHSSYSFYIFLDNTYIHNLDVVIYIVLMASR